MGMRRKDAGLGMGYRQTSKRGKKDEQRFSHLCYDFYLHSCWLFLLILLLVKLEY